ncbi:SAM-dependent methyltransferase [Kitasatospora cystarginea]|uniref:SAM-dependent methyltransferase n=1 Tax=Kitasatospora cystarginea TaxID=58350 RepID=A0ABN3ED36_9ACTN
MNTTHLPPPARTPWGAVIPDPGDDQAAGPDFSRASSARLTNYLLGGQSHLAADRKLGDALLTAAPDRAAEQTAVACRAFMATTTVHLASIGVRQFVDLGCGLPAPSWRKDTPELHQLVHECAEDARVLYVDIDPTVMTHARALLRGARPGTVGHLEADLTAPAKVLTSPELAGAIDLKAPVAVSLHDVLHLIPDHLAYPAVEAYKQALPSGSTLTISHQGGDSAQLMSAAYRSAEVRYHPRGRDEVARFFDGWELTGPGVAPVSEWPSSLSPDRSQALRRAGAYAAIARKP